nr:murein biosynthesis integral membrane protein MurJ [Anaerolineae bacterium]
MTTAPTKTTVSKTTNVARSAVIVAVGLGLSIPVGLLRQRIVGTTFGIGAALDAYTAANGIPELLYTILAGGALAFAFIPVYTQRLAQDGPADANRLFSSIVNAVFILTSIASLAAAIAAPLLVSAPWGIAPHFAAEGRILTVQLMRILLLSTLVFAVSSIVTGSLHAHQHFLLPALAPIMYSLGIIAGALFFSSRLGVHGLAWGAVAGSFLHLAIQIPAIVKYRVRWRPLIALRDRGLRRVATLMAPRVVDLMMARISIDWINSNLGSGLGEGHVSALRYALQLMNMPWTLIGTAIGIAVFPTMAALAASGTAGDQRRALSGSLKAIITLSFPAAAGLILLGQPIIKLLYEGGEFTTQGTELVYYALQFYAIALISQSVLEVVIRAFAAQQDTFTPLLVSIFTTALNILLAIWLSSPVRLAHGGLALANGLAVGVECLIGLIILRTRWRGIDGRRLLIHAIKTAAAALLMSGAVMLTTRLVRTGTLYTLLIGATVALITYFPAAYLLGIKEITTIPKLLLRRLIPAPGSIKNKRPES